MPLWNGKETPEEYEDRKRRNEEKAAAWEERQRLFEEKKRIWEEGEATRSYNRGRIEHLIQQAQNLYYASDFYSARAHQTMKDLQASAKEHRYVGKDHKHLNDAFWQASQEFYNKRDEHFLAQRRKNEEGRSFMQLLVNRAEMVANNPMDFRAAHTELEEITNDMNRHRCAKEDSDYLWGKLRSIKNDFHEKWRAFNKKKTEERERWDRHRETARDVNGNVIGEYKVGNRGYVQTTKNNFGKGHTTGWASGDQHHHGTHSSGGKTSHFTETGEAPSGKIISNYVKK